MSRASLHIFVHAVCCSKLKGVDAQEDAVATEQKHFGQDSDTETGST